jgi:undecaprenyl-diphosphatase
MGQGWRTPLNFGLLLMLLTIALGFALALGVGEKSDRAMLVAFAFRSNDTPAWMIEGARWISWLGDPAQRSVIMIGFAAWLVWDRRFGAAVAILVVPTLGAATSSILKEAFARLRPDVVRHLDSVQNLSYPSGHAAGAMALFLTASLLWGGARPRVMLAAALILAAITGLTRIWLGVHYPSDVVGGWLWGAGWALVGVALAERYGVSRK